MRSLLFVPADSDKKIARAASAGADALVFDLEDAVLPERKPLARRMVREHFDAQSDRGGLWVRVNDLESGELLKDLVAVVPARPAGVLLPKLRAPQDVARVGDYLEALETAEGLPVGGIEILALVTETPAAVLRMGELIQHPHPRLKYLSWGGEDLSSALGAGDPRDEHGQWRPVYDHARTQCLLAGHAMGISVLDTVYVDFRDREGLARSCRQSRYDGFTGRIAIHPDQVPVINEAFTPTAEERALAERIVAAFASGAGAVSIDGKMYDIPHLKAARRLLGQSG